MDFDRNGDIIRAGVPNSPSPPARKDTRDIRDPQKLGEWLLKRTPEWVSARSMYDTMRVARDHISNYPQDESMGTVAARQYREELEERAREGDKYAVSALAGIDAGKGVQGYDDSGN